MHVEYLGVGRLFQSLNYPLAATGWLHRPFEPGRRMGRVGSIRPAYREISIKGRQHYLSVQTILRSHQITEETDE